MSNAIHPLAMLVLIYLCDRYSDERGYAWPSIDRIALDLGFQRRAVSSAIKKLESGNLISRTPGRGRGHTTKYKLPWLRSHLVQADTDRPIAWDTSGIEEIARKASTRPSREKGTSPDTIRNSGKSASERRKRCTERSEKVPPAAPKQNNSIKQAHHPHPVRNNTGDDVDVSMYAPPGSRGPAEEAMVAALTEKT